MDGLLYGFFLIGLEHNSHKFIVSHTAGAIHRICVYNLAGAYAEKTGDKNDASPSWVVSRHVALLLATSGMIFDRCLLFLRARG